MTEAISLTSERFASLKTSRMPVLKKRAMNTPFVMRVIWWDNVIYPTQVTKTMINYLRMILTTMIVTVMLLVTKKVLKDDSMYLSQIDCCFCP